MKEYHLIRKVAKSGPVYFVTLPPVLGRILHGRLIEVSIKLVEIPKASNGGD